MLNTKKVTALLVAAMIGLFATAQAVNAQQPEPRAKTKAKTMEKVKPPTLVKKRLSPGEAQGFNPQPDIPGKTKTTINPAVNTQGSKQ
jgi:hypothetical protein